MHARPTVRRKQGAPDGARNRPNAYLCTLGLWAIGAPAGDGIRARDSYVATMQSQAG
jgi:hypothetical protein